MVRVDQADTNISPPFHLPSMEQSMLALWAKEQVFEKSLQQRQDSPPFLFYDGPPFATGLPHHGHLLASTVKDIVGRYMTMQGCYVSRRFGWDTHGLPIEHEIDKQFGKATHEVVAELGIAKYSDACRGIVQRYVSQWQDTITRLGRWVDFDHDYKTMDVDFMESVWWVFKQLWDKELIYLGNKVVPFSTALGTVLSNFEASSNYQSVQDPAITVLFACQDEPWYFAAWTTTPWTLPSNLALAVGPDITYVLAHDAKRDIKLVIANDCLKQYKSHDLRIERELLGSELVGKRYQPLFPYFAKHADQGAFQVIAADFVVTGEGTAIVHMAPAFGEDDQRCCREAGIDIVVCPIDDAGCFTEAVGDYQGQYVKKADKGIIHDLKADGRLYEQRTIVHNYPYCPRSDTPLLYRAVPSWYVKVEAIKERLLAANKQIHWVPSHIAQGRFGHWLEGARDWAISRNRIWGTPLPIWFNAKSKRYLCIASRQELADYSGQMVDDLHRDVVDAITFSVPGEKGVYERIPEVLDCWFESGSMPYAQLHYPFEHEAIFEQSFPAAFIAEGLDQTRGWFYTLTVLAVALFDQPAFLNVVVTGMVMAEDGKKMSKRLKNYTAPDALMDQYGADALRLYLIHSGLVKGEEQRFSDSGVQDMVRRTLLPWYNAFKFFDTYAKLDGWHASKHRVQGNHILDAWLRARCHALCQRISASMAAYHLYEVVPELLGFIDDLTNIYIRLNRSRFWAEGMAEDKCAAYTALHDTLYDLSRMMAPLTPFMAEYVFRELRVFSDESNISVHLCDYPEADERLMLPELEQAVDRMQQILLLGRQCRNDAKIKVKIPLRQLTIIHQDQALLDEIKRLEGIICKELNVKHVVYETDEARYIDLYAKPCSPRLGKRLGKGFRPMQQAIEALSMDEIKAFEAVGEMTLLGESLQTEDILIYRQAKADTGVLSNRLISIALDTDLDDALRMEGMAREWVSAIQKARKESGFSVSDRIEVSYEVDAGWDDVLAKHGHYMAHETLTTAWHQKAKLTGDIKSLEIDGMPAFRYVLKQVQV